LRADCVARAVERRPFARGERTCAFEHRVEDVGFDAELGDLRDMLQHETLFGDGGGEAHFVLSLAALLPAL